MSMCLRKLLTSRFKKLIVSLCLLFAVLNAIAQPAVPGYTYIGTHNGHHYYISLYAVNGAVIAESVAGTQTILNNWPGIPPAQVYAATISDQAENDAIQGFVIAHNETVYGAGNGLAPGGSFGDRRNVWIGLSDDPTSAAGASETNFRWMNGEPVCFTNWNTCEPNNFVQAVDEDFAQMLIMQNYSYALPSGTGCPEQVGTTINPLGKWNDYFNLPNLQGDNQLYVILEIGVAPTSCPPPPCNLTVSASVAALSCDVPNVIYLGYGTQSVTATSNEAGSTFTWYGVGNSTPVANGATFTPTSPGTYYVVATNGNCTASTIGSATQITVIDVRCYTDGKDKPHKIYVCHKKNAAQGNGIIGNNAETLCVDASAVPAHLAHGDCLGQCESDNSTSRSNRESLPAASALDKTFAVSGYPNPSRTGFSIRIHGASTEKATVKVTDLSGRLIEQRTNIAANQVLKIGDNYKAGMYYVEVVQGANKQQLKMVKQ